MRNMIDFIKTDGSGLWSNVVKTVKCVSYDVHGNQGEDFGELRVYFDTDTWNVDNDGLIYTDEAFLKGIIECFENSDITYSEQGMQGDNFVSFDIGGDFLMAYGE